MAPGASSTRGEDCHMSPLPRGLSSAPAQPCAPSPASAGPAAARRPGPRSSQRRSQRRSLLDQWGPWARRLAGLRARLPAPDPQVRWRLDATARSPDPPISPASCLGPDWSRQNRGQHSPPLPALSGQDLSKSWPLLWQITDFFIQGGEFWWPPLASPIVLFEIWISQTLVLLA